MKSTRRIHVLPGWKNALIFLSGIGVLLSILVSTAFSLGHRSNSAQRSNNTTAASATFARAVAVFNEDATLAATLFEQVLVVSPNHAKAWSNLGACRLALDQLGLAQTALAHALRLDASQPTAHYNQGVVLLRQGQAHAALNSLNTALRLRPAYTKAAVNAAAALLALQQPREAISLLDPIRTSTQLAPSDQGPLLINLAAAHALLGEPAAAHRHALQALQAAPGCSAVADMVLAAEEQLVLWPGTVSVATVMEAARHQLVSAHIDACPMLPTWRTLFAPWPEDLSSAVTRRCAAGLLASAAPPPHALSAARRGSAWIRQGSHLPSAHGSPRPLRVGYVTCDFRKGHPSSDMLAGLFARHTARVQAHVYYYGPDDGNANLRTVQRDSYLFRHIEALDAVDAAALIAGDELDVLVDLSGLTQGARPEILALRPAPVLVSWMGYVGTQGGLVDAVLADAVVVLDATHFAERVLRLPHCYFCVEPRLLPSAAAGSGAGAGAGIDTVSSPRPAELPTGALVLCAFHGLFKIDLAVFRIWMAVLRRVPEAVLWLLDAGPAPRETFARQATDLGVSPSRLIWAPRVDKQTHLARMTHASLFVDAIRCNGHTSVADALLAGLPVVTLQGGRWATRVAASMLFAADLPDLVTTTVQDYEAAIVRLAQEPALLAGLRARLRAAHTSAPLFNATLFVEGLEQALHTAAGMAAETMVS